MKNSASLNFFFLDEGFGTLDKNTIDVVMKSLERLSGGGMSVGIITHVEEVKERLPVRLVVEAAVPRGTRKQSKYKGIIYGGKYTKHMICKVIML